MFQTWRLIAKLRSGNPDTRREALEKVRHMQPVPGKTLPALIELLDDPYEVIRFYSADAIERVVPPATLAVPALMRAYGRNANEDVRTMILAAFGGIGASASAAVPLLVTAINSGTKKERLFASQAVARIGPAAEKAIPVLVSVLLDEASDLRLRVNAAGALGFIATRAHGDAMQALQSAADDRNSEVCENAQESLRRLRQ
jgi:hypothetical protein